MKNSKGENTEGGTNRRERKKTHEKVGGNGRDRELRWESKMREEIGRGKDGERRDSQSMKQFDNLVILLLKSICCEGPAIKLDTQ